MKDINCPYCNAELNIDHCDGQGYDEDELHQQECEDCNKSFVFTTSIIYSYYPSKADCLNGGNHNYKIVTTYPKYFSKMRCTSCDDERSLTEDEKVKHKIPSKEEFLKTLV